MDLSFWNTIKFSYALQNENMQMHNGGLIKLSLERNGNEAYLVINIFSFDFNT